MMKSMRLLVNAAIFALCVNATAQQPWTTDFNHKRAALNDDRLFSIFNTSLSSDERSCLQFLYAYMSLPDITDYPASLYKECTDIALATRREMPWGKDIPDNLFMHFVLPPRVNNENIDSCRRVFYADLKQRVGNMGIKDAILEINHWCKEHVTYRPTDARTKSPLTTVRVAYGRCGEESTFLVSALRAVGIPARQVYTPRWAHTDDNHAWVEAWADGKWWFLGACEPEPVLNLGWFNIPASRAMMMHTKVFGNYTGPEEVIRRTSAFTEINVTSNYAPVRTLTVAVVGDDGKPVENADVEFKLYNYAEFYTLVKRQTDKQGKCSFNGGKGDLLVWVSKDGAFTCQKADLRTDSSLTIRLSQHIPTHLAIVPPQPTPNIPDVDEDSRKANDLRIIRDDSVRNAYERTFPTNDEIDKMAYSNSIDTATARKIIAASRGNHEVISGFISEANDKRLATQLLMSLREKDLQDITADILNDNISHAQLMADKIEALGKKKIAVNGIICPRIADEMIVNYKNYLCQQLSSVNSIDDLARWCENNIRIDTLWNPQNLIMSPISVCKYKVPARQSLNVFFVAAARSRGLAARINAVDGYVQWWDGKNWSNIQVKGINGRNGKAADADNSRNGFLSLRFNNSQLVDNPKYYTHFTLSKIVNGKAQLLNYPEEATFNDFAGKAVPIECGKYLLTSGFRNEDGSVFSCLNVFDIEPYKTTDVELELKKMDNSNAIMGNIDMTAAVKSLRNNHKTSLASLAEDGLCVIGLISANHEPTNHALRDIALCSDFFRDKGIPVALVFSGKDEADRFGFSEFKSLLSISSYFCDYKQSLQSAVKKSNAADGSAMPVFMLVNANGDILYCSTGYNIGIGEQIVNKIKSASSR